MVDGSACGFVFVRLVWWIWCCRVGSVLGDDGAHGVVVRCGRSKRRTTMSSIPDPNPTIAEKDGALAAGGVLVGLLMSN